MCPLDRILRILIGAGLVYLGFFGQTILSNDVLRLVLGVIGVINIISSLLGVCPMYKLANLSTLKHHIDQSSLLEKSDLK